MKSTALATGAAALSARSYAQVRGANERAGIGVIGFGLIGRMHARSFQSLPASRVVAVADVYEPRRKAAGELLGSGTSLYSDFRRLLEDKNVDAVVVATPDHWHALHTMLACAAGKDVYVEKPLHLFVREGRWMMEVAKRYQRVVQVGAPSNVPRPTIRPRANCCGPGASEKSSRCNAIFSGTSRRASGVRRTVRRRTGLTGQCCWARRQRGLTTRTAASTISVGSGIIRAAK
ncbi:MAG TPA: Gfo/Idh/MocA family oxidoreductase [Verrucomicrobiae bacterium]|nr:Gfo/Idh/MocA family oxidoreductase [Verrucomicrobiae bacterium]